CRGRFPDGRSWTLRPILCRFAGKSIGPPPLSRRTFLVITPALPKTLDETNGRAEEIEMFTQPVLQEALVTEMQPLPLVGEDDKRGWRNPRLSHIKDFDVAGRRRSSARQVDIREPAIQLARGDSPLAGLRYMIDQAVEVFNVLARQC